MLLSALDDPRRNAALDELADLQRSKARQFAAEARVLARLEVGTTRGDWQAEAPYDSLLLDVAGTALIGQQAAHARIEQAVHLVRRLPRLLDELDRGQVWVPQARVVIEETLHLSPTVCVEVEARIADGARTCAPGPLRRTVRALILAVDAEEAARRAAAAKVDRKVWSRPVEDGQALLLARGPAEQIRVLQLRLDADARAAKTAGDDRTLDQLRFDLLCSSGAVAGKPVQVLVHVPVATALGLSDEPGVLDGYGPICAATTRQLVTDAHLRKVCVDSATGRVVAVERKLHRQGGATQRTLLRMVTSPTTVDLAPESQHDPSAALARAVRLRDPQCDGPGCSQPAGRCELDHQQPWPAGPTSFTNLRPRSQRCHHAKHAGWTVKTDADGTSHWTSPGRRTYTVPTRDRPPPDLSHISVRPRVA